jgi:hypothetical protein
VKKETGACDESADGAAAGARSSRERGTWVE